MTADLTMDPAVIAARSAMRADEQAQAAREGRHFWIVGVMYRASAPGDDTLIDPEGLCGFTGVHCANCGEDREAYDPTCAVLWPGV